jgi:hypothetical protein
MALRWKSSLSNREVSNWVLISTASGSTLGSGQWASRGVQQTGRAGMEFMWGILPGCLDAG